MLCQSHRLQLRQNNCPAPHVITIASRPRRRLCCHRHRAHHAVFGFGASLARPRRRGGLPDGAGAAGVGGAPARRRLRRVGAAAPSRIRADAHFTGEVAGQREAAWIVLDSYAYDEANLQVLQRATRLLVVDDTASLASFDCDVILNQNSYADDPDLRASYRDRAPRATQLMGGRYALLRREYWAYQNRERKIGDEVERILVSMGGADASNASALVMEALARVGGEFLVTVVAGVANPHRDILRALAQANPSRFEIKTNVQDMPALLAQSDAAVLAGGSSVWEACFMGLPFVTLTLAQNQVAIAEHLDLIGVAASLGWAAELDARAMAQRLGLWIGDYESRRQSSRLGQQLVDERGAFRVVEAMLGEASAGQAD